MKKKKNNDVSSTEESIVMYSPGKGEGNEIIKVGEIFNKLSGMEYFANIGFADSFYEYWLLPPSISSKRLTIELIAPFLDQHIDNILVLGSGRGGELILLNELTDAEMVGLDITSYNLKQSKDLVCKKGKKDSTPLIKGTADILPFKDNSFSCVYSCEAAFHFPDKKAFIEEVNRVLKKGGCFILADITKKEHLSEIQTNVMKDYKAMLNSNQFYTKKKYADVIRSVFGKEPTINDITAKNIKHLAKGSNILLMLFKYMDKVPLLREYIDKIAAKRGIDMKNFVRYINTTKLSYEKKVVEYLMIYTTK